jgi:DNA modification methylase
MNTPIQNIKIEEVSIGSLKASSYNPRKMTEKQEIDLTESIKRFGLIDPIIVNSYKERENIIIGGHARFKLAKKLDFKTVPVVYLSLPLNKEKELNLRLNRNTGEWDYELLKSFEVDLLLDTGFDELDFSKIFDDTLEVEDDNFNIEKEIEKAKTTKIKTGDLFEIAGQRIICGDCNNIETIKKLMGEDKADMIYTDPPYNIGINYSKGLGGKQNYGGVVNDNKNDNEYKEFIKKSLSNGLSVSKDDVHVFYYHDPKYTGVFQEIYKELKVQYKRTALWVKNGMNITHQTAFNRCYEPVLYGTKGKPYLSNTKNLSEILNKDIENGNRAIDDILDMLDIWLVKRLPSIEYEHPTDKNPELHEKAIRRCTKVNDVILDMFGGGGSLAIACAQLKRRSFICEQSPIFVQLIINRLEKYANTKAKQLN